MSRLPLMALAALVILSAPATAQEAVDHLGVPGPIVLAGRDYRPVWSERPRPGYVKQEYRPEGGSLASCDSMKQPVEARHLGFGLLMDRVPSRSLDRATCLNPMAPEVGPMSGNPVTACR